MGRFALLFGVAAFALTGGAVFDDGKIALDTPAFGDLGLRAKDKRFATITIAQLTNHSSGLKNDVRVVSSDPLDVAKAAVASKLLFTPGWKQVYSNTAFNVLGAVIEKASGEDYRSYVQRNVFAPGGVTDAAALDLAKTVPNQVAQYDKSDNAAVNTIPLSGTPAGLKPRPNGAYYAGGWDAVFAEFFNGGKSGGDVQWTTAKPIENALAKR